MQTQGDLAISYNRLNLPATIGSAIGSADQVTLDYDGAGMRVHKLNPTTETFYLDDFYFRTKVRGTSGFEEHMVVGSGGHTVAEVVRAPSGTDATYFLHQDRLGSVEAVTLGDSDGTLVESRVFEAFGERLNASNPTDLASRGYAGQENVGEFGLINMKARLYDPQSGRFLQPDTIVSGSGSQALNPYSYVMNNPVGLVDPTGHTSISIQVTGPPHLGGVGGEIGKGLNESGLGREVRARTVDAWQQGPTRLVQSMWVFSAGYSGGFENPWQASDFEIDPGKLSDEDWREYDQQQWNEMAGDEARERTEDMIEDALWLAANDGKSISVGSGPEQPWEQGIARSGDPRPWDGALARVDIHYAWPGDDAMAFYADVINNSGTSGLARIGAWIGGTLSALASSRLGPITETVLSVAAAASVSIPPKIESQMGPRGWTPAQIQEAVGSGEQIPAINKANGNPAIRYIHPETGQSVVVDQKTGEVIHVGGRGFKYGPESGDLR